MLTDVRLGMPYRDLHKVRMGAVPAPYVGLQEKIRDDSVRYRFDEGAATDIEDRLSLRAITPAAIAPLEAVDIWSYFDRMTAADSTWHSRVKAAESLGTLTCYTFHQDLTEQRAVVVVTKDAQLGAVMYPPRIYGGVTGKRSRPAIVRTFVARHIDKVIPKGARRERVPCEASSANATLLSPQASLPDSLRR